MKQEKSSDMPNSCLAPSYRPISMWGRSIHFGYETALVQIHDFHRREVGGIPSLCFLIATRLGPDEEFDYTKEDSSIILAARNGCRTATE